MSWYSDLKFAETEEEKNCILAYAKRECADDYDYEDDYEDEEWED